MPEKKLVLCCGQCTVEVLFTLDENGEGEISPLVPLCSSLCHQRLTQLVSGDCSMEEQ